MSKKKKIPQRMKKPEKKKTQRQEFFTLLQSHLTDEEMEKVNAAYEFSKSGHARQKRDDGSRYFNHPRSVALILMKELDIYDWRILVVTLLHDIMEDTHLLSEKRISINFGPKAAQWTKLLTKEDEDYIQALMKCMIWEVLLIKLADRLHNLRTLRNCKKKKQKRKLAETREDYFPLAELLIEILPQNKKNWGKYLQKQIRKECA